MSFGMTNTQVEHHMRDVRRDVARSRSSRTPRPGHGASRTPRLRRRVGLTLVEAGLRLLATEGDR